MRCPPVSPEAGLFSVINKGNRHFSRILSDHALHVTGPFRIRSWIDNGALAEQREHFTNFVSNDSHISDPAIGKQIKSNHHFAGSRADLAFVYQIPPMLLYGREKGRVVGAKRSHSRVEGKLAVPARHA